MKLGQDQLVEFKKSLELFSQILLKVFTKVGINFVPFASMKVSERKQRGNTGNTNGGSITVPLTSCLTGLE